MRVDDRSVPTIGGHRPGPDAPISWPVDLYVGVERQPVAQYVYDDYTVSYDAPGIVYDDTTIWPYDRYDLTCYIQGLDIETGSPDIEGRFDAGRVAMTLDNTDGSLSQYDSAGRLVDWVPGAALDIWATIGSEPFWLFSGRVTAWRERADNTVDVEAFDAFSELSRDVAEWDPGVYGDGVAARLENICAEHGFVGPRRFDIGDVTLHSYFTTASPLEEMRNVAVSDGGFLVCDADGTLTYTDRTWITGRSDQTDIPTFTDNVCDAGWAVWEAEVTTDDDIIANTITLTAVDDITVTATNTASVNRYGPRALTRSGDQWIGTAAGLELAEAFADRLGDHYQRLEQFQLQLDHPNQQGAWEAGIDRRLGDIVTWVHEQPTTTGAGLLILNLVLASIRHEITVDGGWTATYSTTRTVGNVIALRYDWTPYRYGDPAAIYAL